MKNILAILVMIVCSIQLAAQENNTQYSGTINGFNPNWNFNSGKLFVKNVVTEQTESYVIPIDSQGNFSTDFFLDNNRECWVSFPFFNSAVYFGQDKHIIQDFDVTDPNQVIDIFKGDFAQINNDVNKVRSLFFSDWDLIYKDIYNLSAQEYKDYFLKIKEDKINQLDSIRKDGGLHEKAYDLAYLTISYAHAWNLMDINSIRESAYRRQNNLSFENRDPMIEPFKLQADYYSFLKELPYNDQAAMEVNEYGIFINHLKNIAPIYDEVPVKDYTQIIDQLKQADSTDQQAQGMIQALQNLMNKKTFIPEHVDKIRPTVLSNLLQTDITLELELIESQRIAGNLDYTKIPLSDDSLQRLATSFSDHYLFVQLRRLNDQIKATNVSNNINLQQNPYTKESVTASGDRTLEDLIAPYKGKVIFIDFWATWCGPCLDAIKDMSDIKPEFKDDIVFLYITNDSSPESAYQSMAPSIEGEHYRLTMKEYDVISNRFKIHGIPRYMIADRSGQIQYDDYRWSYSLDLKRKFAELIK